MKLTKTLGLGAILAASLATAAFASGIFQGYPVVGSAAFCATNNSQQGTSTVPGAAYSNSQCTTTVPAGPTTLTGNETWPVDTNIANGAGQETVRVPTVMVSSGAYFYNAPLTGASLTVPASASNVVLNPAGTIAALTLTLPAASSLIDGQVLRIGSSQTVTALTITPGSGTTIAQNPTAITVSTTASYGYEFVYIASLTKWIRVQ